MKYLPIGLAVVAGAGLGSAAKWSSSQPARKESTKPLATKIAREEPARSLTEPEPSTDSLNTLRDLKLPHRTARVALWVQTASEADVAALWESLLADGPRPDLLCELVLSRWVALNPPKAMAAARAASYSTFVWTALAEIDAKAAYKTALESDDPVARASVAKVLALKDPDYVISLLERGEDKQLTAYGLAEGFIAQRQFEKGLDAEFRFEHGANTATIFREWGKDDPEALFLWGAKNPNLLTRYNSDDEIVLEITKLHAEKIPDILAKLPTGEIKSRLQKTYVISLAEKDPEAAIKFLSQAESPERKSELLAAAGATLSRSKPEMATAALRDLLDEGLTLEQQVQDVFFPSGPVRWQASSPLCAFANELVKQAPETTMDALMAAGTEQRYQDAAGEIAEIWMKADAWDFSAWLKKQSAGAERDRLAVSLANHITSEAKPAFTEAAGWLSTISDAPSRDRELKSLLVSWRVQDPDSLAGYLSSSSASEAVRKLVEHKGQ